MNNVVKVVGRTVAVTALVYLTTKVMRVADDKLNAMLAEERRKRGK